MLAHNIPLEENSLLGSFFFWKIFRGAGVFLGESEMLKGWAGIGNFSRKNRVVFGDIPQEQSSCHLDIPSHFYYNNKNMEGIAFGQAFQDA